MSGGWLDVAEFSIGLRLATGASRTNKLKSYGTSKAMTEMHVDHQSSRLNHRAMGRSGVVMGMAVLIACMAFFGFDVVADVFDHALGRTPYALGELVHLIFEILAVIGLSYAAATLRAYLRLLQTQAASSRDTIHMLRGNFDEVLRQKFEEWSLTSAERDVTLLIIRGLSVAEIAAARNTAQGTIKAQSTSIFRKIGVGSKGELMSLIIDEFLDLSS